MPVMEPASGSGNQERSKARSFFRLALMEDKIWFVLFFFAISAELEIIGPPKKNGSLIASWRALAQILSISVTYKFFHYAART